MNELFVSDSLPTSLYYMSVWYSWTNSENFKNINIKNVNNASVNYIAKKYLPINI